MIKRLFILLTVIFVCLGLCSCTYKDTQVKLTTDDNTVELDGNKYILTDEVGVYPTYSKQVYVTENGVPVPLVKLLNADWYSNTKSYLSKSEYFIVRGGLVYCREDIYSKLDEVLTPEAFDSYAYQFYHGGKQQGYTLSEDEKSAVDKVLNNTEPIPSYDLGYMPVTKHYIELTLLDTETNAVKYLQTLHVLEDGYCFTAIQENGTTEYYIVPEELEPYYDSMTKAYTDVFGN